MFTVHMGLLASRDIHESMHGDGLAVGSWLCSGIMLTAGSRQLAVFRYNVNS